MSKSYTPGLKVLKKTLFRKERILPLKGKVLVKKGDKLSPETIVASTSLIARSISSVVLSPLPSSMPRPISHHMRNKGQQICLIP